MSEVLRLPTKGKLLLKDRRFTKLGRVTIRYDPKQGALIEVEGFEFSTAEEPHPSCREACMLAVDWAQDVLFAAYKADEVVPGGSITVVNTD